MMYLEVIEKSNWLRSACSAGVSRELGKTIAVNIEEAFACNTLPRRVADVVELDLCYVLLRNSRWCQLPLFQEIILDYFISYFSLDRECCERMIASCIRDFKQVLPSRELDETNEMDFLRYLFVFSAFAHHDTNLENRFGFGDHIFKRMRKAFELVQEMDKKSEGQKASVFVGDIDAKFMDIIFRISDDYSRDPRSLDLHKFDYVLADIRPEQKLVIASFGREHLVDGLIQLGEKKTMFFADIQKMVKHDAAEIANVLAILSDVGLIFRLDDTAKQKREKWCLSNLGYEIAAPAFARKFWLQDAYSCLHQLRSLGAAYQEACLGQLPSLIIASFLEYSVDHWRSFTPKAIRILLESIDGQGFSSISQQIAERLLMAQQLGPWIRAEACDFLSQVGASQPIRQLLQDVAESDSSVLVRDRALLGLTYDGHS